MKLVLILTLLLFGTMAVVMNACDNVRLSLRPAEATSASTSGEICAATPNLKKHYTKVMFLVDKSGSNHNDVYPDGSPYKGTDSDKQFRFSTINNYLNKMRTNSEMQWGFIAFNDLGANAYINTGSEQVPKFSASAIDMDNALRELMSVPDAGRTPYRAAINMAIESITRDRQQGQDQGVSSTYVVVLMSDGAPTDYIVTGTENNANGGTIDEAAIDTDVIKLTQADTTLSTIYYGYSTDIEPARLERMAKVGGGKFSNVNIDGQVPIDSLIKFGSSEPWIIKRFVVTNLNAAPCDDGTVDTDSDADGICDKDELNYNKTLASDPNFSVRMNGKTFDPYNRNSFSSVYSDLIWYRHIVYNEQVDTGCTDTSDGDNDLLNFCEERFLKSNTPSGPTTTWTGLMQNDADPLNPDSDGDGFLDFHEFVFALGRLTSDALQFTSPSKLLTGGYTSEQILLEHRNPRSPAATQAYDGQFEFTRVNSQGQNCYQYTQNVLPLYPTKALKVANTGGRTELAHADGENVVMIYFVQTAEVNSNGPGELRYMMKKMKPGDPMLAFDWDIGLYVSYLANQSRVSPTRNAGAAATTGSSSP